MSEIKFRAWLKAEKKIVEVVLIDFWNKKVVVADPEDPAGFGTVNFDNVVLILYTGLKDKNGREICEGDIVELHTPAEGIIGRYIVKWDEVAACFYLEGNWEIAPDEIWEHSQSWLTVIGNIYENPELLREGK